MALLCLGIGPLCTGSFGQDDGLYSAGGVALDSLVAEKTDQLAKNSSGHSVFLSWIGDGLGHGMVGTLPSRHESNALCILESD